MRKIFTIISAVLISASIYSQAPNKFSYQAVVRNADGVLMQNSKVGIKISLLQGSVSGTVVYAETHNTETNANGLISVVIGEGKSSTDKIASIKWANGPYFIKTETDPGGGTSYTIVGTNELLSVPYALFSTNETPGPQGPAGPQGPTGGYPVHTIGESYGGGIVFYVYDNGQHGLIAATSDQSTGIRWYGGTYANTRARAKGVGAGKANTAIIIANQASFDGAPFAATICNEYIVTVNGVDYGDWYLPSITELMLLYQNKDRVGGLAVSTYWSSTEYEGDWAFIESFIDGVPAVTDKGGSRLVRAIRAF